MSQMLDVLFVKSTGHVLSVAVRAGSTPGPDAAGLAGERLFYPHPLVAGADRTKIVDVPIPAGTALDRISVALTDPDADALFQREAYAVKDGRLVAGLGPIAVGRAGDDVTLTVAASSETTPFLAIGVSRTGADPTVSTGEIPTTGSYTLPIAFPSADYLSVLVFAKGYEPTEV